MAAPLLKRIGLVLALGLAACLTPVDPQAGDVGQLRVRPQYAQGEEPATLRLVVDSAVVIAQPDADPDEAAVDALVALPAADESLDWLVDVTGAASVYRVRIAVTGGGDTLYRGEVDVTVPPGAVEPGPIHDVPVQYAGPPRAMSLSITPETSTLDAIGGTVTLDATARNAAGDEMDGKTFTWASSAPGVATVDAAGMVTAVAQGEAEISASVDALTAGAGITVAVRAATGRSTIEASPASRVADGTSAATITVRLLDANDHPVTESGGTVELASSLGTPSPVTDHGDGTYTATLTSTVSGLATITGTLNGEVVEDNATVTFLAGPAVANQATITATPESLTADGLAAAAITVRLFDSEGNPLTASGGTVALASSLGTPGAVTDHGDGTYTATISSTVAGTAIITGTLDGVAIDDDATVTFLPGPAAPNTAIIGAAPVEVAANGDDAAVITVQLMDGFGNRLTQSGGTVVLTPSLGTLTPVIDHQDGTYTASLRSHVAGVATVTGTLNDEPIEDAAEVLFFVVDQTIATIAISPAEASLAAFGATQPFSAVARNAAGDAIPDVAFAWSGGDDAVATVDAVSGVALATGNGTVTVTATAGGVSGTATLTVEQRVTLLSLSLTCPSSIPEDDQSAGIQAIGCDTLTAVGQQVQIVAEAFDANGHPVASPVITWATDAPGVASVDLAGLVTAEGNGTAVITASADDATATIEIVVIQAVDSVTVEPSPLDVSVGGQGQLTARAFDANGHQIASASFTWFVLDPAIAQVDQNGLVTGIAFGFTKVRVSADGIAAQANVAVRP